MQHTEGSRVQGTDGHDIILVCYKVFGYALRAVSLAACDGWVNLCVFKFHDSTYERCSLSSQSVNIFAFQIPLIGGRYGLNIPITLSGALLL